MRLVYNPNPIFLHFEIHHFDYGLLLLLVTSLLLLFGKKRYYTYLFMTAVSFGLILDELWFIRSSIVDPNIQAVSVYNTTFPTVVVFVITIIFMVILIDHFKEKK